MTLPVFHEKNIIQSLIRPSGAYDACGTVEGSTGGLPIIFLSSAPVTTSVQERRWANSSKTVR